MLGNIYKWGATFINTAALQSLSMWPSLITKLNLNYYIKVQLHS